jgi:hypothetical protein
MAGSRFKRMRRARATDPVTGEPCSLTCRVCPGSRRAGRNLSSAEKVKHLLGMSLDRAAEIMMWRPLADLDELQLSLRMPVWRVVFIIGAKAMLDGSLEREITSERGRERPLEELTRDFAAREA